MKKSIKRLITVFAVCAVSAFAVVASGCNVTDKIKEKIEQARCEHEYSEVIVVEESTCSENGKGEKTCAKCGKVETVKLDLADHVAIVVEAVSPTCTKSGKTDSVVCSVCEKVITASQELSPLGHIVVKDKAVKPTCLESGLTEGEHCSRCNEVLKARKKVPATGHNLVILEAVEPTCTTEGKTQGVWCDKCETIFTEQETLPSLRHLDEDEDGLCDGCQVTSTATVNMVEVVFESGELAAGNWYRLYAPTGVPSITTMTAVRLSGNSADLIVHSDPAYSSNYVFCSGPLYTLEGFEVVFGDGYIDFHLVEGTYKLVRDGEVKEDNPIVIDSTTTISFNPSYAYGRIVRLVEKEV